MEEGNRQEQRTASGGRRVPPPPSFSDRIVEAAARVWRPAGSVLAVVLALLLTWHVVSGKHGLSVWQQKRVEDMQLHKEIDGLQQENARLRQRIEKLKSDPHAIEREAREKLHYAKSGEVIYTLPPDPAPTAPAGK